MPVALRIFNIRGQYVRTLIAGMFEPGTYNIKWDGRDDQGILLASGIYFYLLKAGAFSVTRKMIFMK